MSERSPAVMIVNPRAGRLRAGLVDRLVAILSERYALVVLECQDLDELTRLARGAVDGADTVIAVGGDGTVSRASRVSSSRSWHSSTTSA